MGISIRLETENGDELQLILDPTNLLHRVLPEPGDPEFRWANTIDWYGDTVFNRLQTGVLREEWAVLIQSATDQKTKELLAAIDEVLLRCASTNHVYVRFLGD